MPKVRASKMLDLNEHKKAVLANIGLLLFRTGLSVSIFVSHGYSKVSNIFIGNWDFPNPVGLGKEAGLVLSAGAESICVLMIALGILTRLCTIPLIFTMIVATWVINGGAPFIQQEKSFVYLLGWVLLFLTGPGEYTVVNAYRRYRGKS